MRFALVMGEVGQGLRRNLSMVVSVVLVTFISLTFVGASALLQAQVNEMRQFWSDRAQVAREVDRNLVNIRDLSVQSATGAHQTSASSHELSRLAADLSRLVGRFSV